MPCHRTQRLRNFWSSFSSCYHAAMPNPEAAKQIIDRLAMINPTLADAWIWEKTLRSMDYSPKGQAKRRLLKKVFRILRFGGLWFRTEPGADWQPWNLPLASALSHGARVMIQYKEGTGLFKWLDEESVLSGRPGASHEVVPCEAGETVGETPSVKKYREVKIKGVLGQISLGKRNAGDYGCDLPMGGHHTVPFARIAGDMLTKDSVGQFESDLLRMLSHLGEINTSGAFGHFYVYRRKGHQGTSMLMVGLEGSSPFLTKTRTSCLGKVHDAAAKAGTYSGAYGVKWTSEHFAGIPHPHEYDSTFVSLGSNWRDALQARHMFFDESWLMHPPLVQAPTLVTQRMRQAADFPTYHLAKYALA